MRIGSKTGLFGVMGFPLAHTLGPRMHNAALAARNVDAVYLAFETTDAEGCVRGMRALGIRGMSVTIPHKSSVLSMLDEVDDLAEKIGAVNTIVHRNGRLTGYNTDAAGALRALEEKTLLEGKSCAIVGAGGAARAIGYGLKERGLPLTIVGRSREKGETLAYELGCNYAPIGEMEEISVDLLVHATPVGMFPYGGDCIVPPNALKEGMVVMDTVYNPRDTMLLRLARKRGCAGINGLGMFIYQGAEQFRLWTGIDAPVEVMAHAVEDALGKAP